ncbi:MAG: hypothetical protein ISS72_08840 [Candidatus Brocadiae bacterium]|nr:hypothetical protein [Candidatus Brocadiia bacterium]
MDHLAIPNDLPHFLLAILVVFGGVFLLFPRQLQVWGYAWERLRGFEPVKGHPFHSPRWTAVMRAQGALCIILVLLLWRGSTHGRPPSPAPQPSSVKEALDRVAEKMPGPAQPKQKSDRPSTGD